MSYGPRTIRLPELRIASFSDISNATSAGNIFPIFGLRVFAGSPPIIKLSSSGS
ncbi:hypothetical protein Hanom_Chr16g01439921 [Helianthus anomalus]